MRQTNREAKYFAEKKTRRTYLERHSNGYRAELTEKIIENREYEK